MKIVYLNGPYRQGAYSRSSRSPAVTKSGTLYYPIWLAYAAGLARQDTDFDIDLVDAVALRYNRTGLVDKLQGVEPDLIICDTSTASIDEDIATVRAIKEAMPECRVVMVGTHATALPEAVLGEEPLIDAVVLGEYDETVIELARALDEGRSWEGVSGICYRREGQTVRTGERELIGDLDRFPFVSQVYRERVKVGDYFFAAAQYPMVMIVTSRGCPHRCGWCVYPQVMHRGKYRVRSAENVAAEFAYIAENMPEIREVGIEDDIFTADKKRLHEICRLLIGQNNRLNFWCDTRVDLDYETMRLMKQAGCRLLIAGFESADQGILDGINKGTRVEQAKTFMDDARRAGLLVHGCFVLGNPQETTRSMQATLEFAKRLNPDTVQFFPMMVYPGTRMYDWAKENGFLRTEDYREWLDKGGLHQSVVDLPGLSGVDVVRFCDYARRKFYLRKGYMFKKFVQSLINIHEAQRNVKALRRFAQFLVKT
ncbi:MAG: radical SAM protein [Planctomycetes bacterium]|nr:radical SAM protein [Planctomycetota bacterium]